MKSRMVYTWFGGLNAKRILLSFFLESSFIQQLRKHPKKKTQSNPKGKLNVFMRMSGQVLSMS
jgi:hypothetical protein